ncbi:PREDICTED: uncharacterized protein LOC108762066 [Trachymyrmex cornetzi]|uniref:uncharacterized protein LOC108762066 n=1 Tax=Trachymyrmex cornetzi TaxID=471704 RepID=UPI00084F57A2|nr:PREDICTED: uncharacterized protein LOC108762066 [Trachymyrmex cornetzi]
MTIPAKNEEENVERLKQVLKRAEEYGLEINKKKCRLLERRIEFLGHVIEDGKLYPSPEKTKTVLKFPEPKTTKEIEAFKKLKQCLTEELVLRGDIPLHTNHLDHLGPLETIHKNYKHILAVIDAFIKFVWLYLKTVTSKEAIEKLELQKSVFGNPTRILSDRDTAFTSVEFEDYCYQEDIEHIKVTVDLLRSNGQIERINKTIISVLAKMSLDEPTK